MALRLITLDVTGTLLMLREPVGQVYARVGATHGITLPPQNLSLNFKIVFKKMLLDHPNFGESGIGWREWWKKLVVETFTASASDGIFDNSKAPALDGIASELVELYKTERCWALADGALELLENLTRANVSLGVISNYDPRLEQILKNLRIRKYFEFVVTSYEAKCSKPDRSIFKTVENMYESISQNQMLHVGDNEKLDYNGAKNAGWHAVLVKRMKGNHPDVDSDQVVTGIDQLLPLLVDKKLILA